MTQRIWILNSSLLGLAAISLITMVILRQTPPVFRKKAAATTATTPAKTTPTLNLDAIIQNDIFGLSSPAKKTAQKQTFSLEMPAFKEPSTTPPAEAKPNELAPPLNLSISGIILAAEEAKSIAMLIDESGKEKMCHLGEKFQDAVVVKISKNKVTLLRESGQQETFFLRKEENLSNPGKTADTRWKLVVQKKEDTTYILDPLLFVHEVPSVGDFMDALGLIPSYRNNELAGLKVTKVAADSLAAAMGLQSNDVITSVNGISLKDAQSRIAIYDDLVDGDAQKPITASLLRGQETVTLTYQRGKVPRVFNLGGVPVPVELRQPQGSEFDQRRRAFEERHRPQHQETIAEVRNRLLGNLRTRAHGRVR